MSCTKFAYRVGASLPKLIPIFGVIFDLDGTLTVSVLDFSVLRSKLNISEKEDILAFVEQKETNAEKEEAMRIIAEFEEEGRQKFALQPGVNEMFEVLHENNLKLAIVTRNDHKSVVQFLKHLKPCFQDGKIFTHILTRDFKPPKPDPAPVLHITQQWGFDCTNVMVVGDHRQDMECGRKAGAVTVLLNNCSNSSFKPMADHNVDTLMHFVDDLQSHIISKS